MAAEILRFFNAGAMVVVTVCEGLGCGRSWLPVCAVVEERAGEGGRREEVRGVGDATRYDLAVLGLDWFLGKFECGSPTEYQ